MWWTNVSCLQANFIMVTVTVTVTVTCIIAYIVWLFLYPCGLWPCNGSV
jgi:phage shock protein PspC (stress-responsive transcriptional regulator)